MHNGHVYHFEQSKAVTGADAAIAVMSGHWLQRGEPALVNKWARAEMALRMGADVVLELPVAYSSQAAEWFAYGAVRMLNDCGVVDSLCFGSESGSIDWLSGLAERLYIEQDDFQQRLARRLEEGMNYPAAYSAAIRDWVGEEGGRLNEPNNTLGLHYLIALRRLNSPIIPATIARHKAGYHDRNASDAHIASATAIRQWLGSGRQKAGLEKIRSYVPSYTLEILLRELEAGRAPISWGRYMQPLLNQIVTRSVDELRLVHEVSEGLEHRIKRCLAGWRPDKSEASTAGEAAFEALIEQMKTKRYTRTKLQRMLVRILLNHRKAQLTRESLAGGPGYIRVLGFSAKGRLLLQRMKKEAACPVLVKIPGERPPFLEMDIQAAGAYSLGYSQPSSAELLRDYYQAPLRIGSE